MDFQDYQRAFTARVRDPRSNPRPKGAPIARMKVYEELLYNNIEGFLLACFPVCRKILGKPRWRRLVRAFFGNHASRTPYFRQIPEEFLKYLQEEWQCPDDFPAFLPELAHYEWVELALDTSNRDEHLPAHDPSGDLMAGSPLLNPVSRVLAYRWPVHRLSPRFKPLEPPAQPTFILAYRDQDYAVHFSAINSVTARMLYLMQENRDLNGTQLLGLLSRERGHAQDALIDHGRTILQDFRRQGVLLGTLL